MDISLISTLAIVISGGFLLYKFVKGVREFVSNSNIVVTNKETGQHVTLGKHPTKGQAKKLLEVIGK